MSGFTRYLFWRLVQMILTLLAVSLMVYAIIEMMPATLPSASCSGSSPARASR